jgi:DNA-binding transcriptional regulator GbsR (MarR family)
MGNMDDRLSRFVERMGLLWEEEGLTRIAGRLFAFLLVQPVPCSLDDLVRALEVSKASISNDARRLERLGLLHRESRPGDRRDYYTIAPDIFTSALEIRLERLRRFHEVLADARTLKVSNTGVRRRLDEFENAHHLAVRMTTDLLTRLRTAVKLDAAPGRRTHAASPRFTARAPRGDRSRRP